MDFKHSEEQELLLKSLSELLEKEAPDSLMAECDEKHEFPWGPWRALAKNGFLGLGIPEKYGGTPADVQTICMVAEEMGKQAFPVGFAYSLDVISIRDIAQFGSEAQKEEILGDLCQGGPPIALGITEPEAGSDSASLRATATLDGDEWVLNGNKMYCTAAHLAKYILFVTRDLENPSPYKAMSMYLLPTDTPGVRINLIRKVGAWPVGTNEVFVDNARVPKSALLGKQNYGWMQLVANFEIERLALAAVCTGGAQAAFDDAAAYANQRVQFGQVIGKFQSVYNKIADMAIKLENMRLLYQKAAWMMDRGLPVRYEASMAKLYASQAGMEVVDDAMQIMGGMGYMMDHRVQRLWRDMRLMRIGGGTDEIMKYIIGPQVLRKYK